MRLLADENLPGDIVAVLHAHGHDVAWIREDSPGIADEDVLARATAEQRVLVTFDKDFGDLAFRQGHMAQWGVVLVRLKLASTFEAAQIICAALASRDDWAGHVSVIASDRLKMTPLPT